VRSRTVPAARARRFCRGLGLAGLAFLAAAAFTPLPVVLARSIGVPARLAPAEAIVVLGADVLVDGSLVSASLRSAIHALRLYRRQLAPLLVFSGPPARADRPAEPAVRAALAAELGIPPAAVLTATAWTTVEEAAHVQALLAPRGIRRILLVTDSQHLVRAGRLFERAGFEVVPAPADSLAAAESPEGRLDLTRRVLAELAARLVYGIAGPA
jgi:uncharacterized SAM-binding protein YcdF (DUF218 family)